MIIADKIMLGSVIADKVYYGSELVWPIESEWKDFTPKTMYFRNDGTSPADISMALGTTKPNLEYTKDGTNWKVWDYSKISIPAGKTLAFRGSNKTFAVSDSDYSRFVTGAPLYCEGNIMSLIDKTGDTRVIPSDYCFYGLFRDSKITKSPITPATTLKKACYWNLFYNCTELNGTVHSLPATNIPESAYRNMYQNTGITSFAAKFPSTITVEGSRAFSGMFKNCTKLSTYPLVVSGTTFDFPNNCTNPLGEMFRNCTALETIGNLAISGGSCASYTAHYMFYGCTGLTDLSNITITVSGLSYAFEYGFAECTAMTAGPTVLSSGIYALSHCFANCKNMVTAAKFGAYDNTRLKQAKTGQYEYVFSGCSKIEKAYFTEYYVGEDSYKYALQNCKAITDVGTRAYMYSNVALENPRMLSNSDWNKVFGNWCSGAGDGTESGTYRYMYSANIEYTRPNWKSWSVIKMDVNDGRGYDPNY